MKPQEKNIVKKALDVLRKRTHLNANFLADTTGADQLGEGVIRIFHEGMQWEFNAEVKLQVNRAAIALMKHEMNHAGKGLLITGYVNPELAEVMRDQDIAFIDAVGNAFIDAPPLYIFVKGNRPDQALRPETAKRLFKPGGLKVVFTLLNIPEMENETYRNIAKKANVALGTVDRVINELKTMNFLVHMGKKGRKLNNREKLLRRWVEAYPEQLRPKLVQQRFRTHTRNWWKDMEPVNFGALWGGETAAAELTGYLKPERHTIYTDHLPGKLIFKFKLQKDPNGNVEILVPFWTFKGQLAEKGLVPPLLIYADLVATGDARAIEAAEKIYDKYIVGIVREDR